jgi:hypothetical protein
MTLDCAALLNAAAGHAASSGWFDQVNQWEAINPVGRGLRCDMWVDRLGPIPEMSGLNSSAARLVITVRVSSQTTQPMGGLDPAVLNAVDALMRAYTGDYSLGDLIEYVDVLGRHGLRLEGQAGWVKTDGGTAARIFDITLPLVVRDLWAQAE